MKKKNKTDVNADNDYCKIFSDAEQITRYHCYLNTEIEEVHHYHELLETLRKALPTDSVTIHINNFGGYMYTTQQILNRMNECNAPITTILEGTARSAASMIFLSGDALELHENSTLMCHYYSGAITGKGNEIETQSAFDKKYIKQLFRDVYKGFLSKSELTRLFKGEDFWFDSKQIRTRLKKKK